MLDLDKAYDRAQPKFLIQVLHAMKFPECFIAVIARLYEDCWAKMKVNGHIGDAFSQKNGLRQGLPSSCPLWIIYIEPFVRYLRDDTKLRGITVPGSMGVGEMQHKVVPF